MPAYKDLAEFVAARKGKGTSVTFNPVTSTVATTATEILRNNPNRFRWVAVNLSTNRGFIDFSNEVSSSRGFSIDAQNGMMEMDLFEDGEAVFNRVFALNQVASGTYFIVEFVVIGGAG
jgi:hypothetical protein